MKVKIYCQDGEQYETDVEESEYDALELKESINDRELVAVEIGGLIFSRIDIKRIIPSESVV